jgi:hypothetical protein
VNEMLKVAVCAAYDRHPASQNREISFRLGLRHKRRVASFGYLARHSFPPFVIHRPLLDGCYLVIWVGIFLLNRGFHPIYVDLRGTVSFPPYFQREIDGKVKSSLYYLFPLRTRSYPVLEPRAAVCEGKQPSPIIANT